MGSFVPAYWDLITAVLSLINEYWNLNKYAKLWLIRYWNLSESDIGVLVVELECRYLNWSVST